jgi:hypothetical protein
MILSYSKWKGHDVPEAFQGESYISQLVYQSCCILHLIKDENFKDFYNNFLNNDDNKSTVKTLLDFISLNKKVTVINFLVNNKYDDKLTKYNDLIKYSLPAAEEILMEFSSIDLIEWIYPMNRTTSESYDELTDIIIYNHKQKIPIKIELEDVNYSKELKEWLHWDEFLHDNGLILNNLVRDWMKFFIEVSSQQIIDVINKEYIENINWEDFKDYKFKKTFGYYLPVLREKHFIYLRDLVYTSFLHTMKSKKNEWYDNEKEFFEKLLAIFIDKDIHWDEFLKSIMLVHPNLWILRNHGLYFNKALTVNEWNDLKITYKCYLSDNNLVIMFSTGHEINLQFRWEDDIICGNLDIKIILK